MFHLLVIRRSNFCVGSNEKVEKRRRDYWGSQMAIPTRENALSQGRSNGHFPRKERATIESSRGGDVYICKQYLGSNIQLSHAFRIGYRVSIPRFEVSHN